MKRAIIEYPFRVVALVLSVLILIELIAILSLPDYSKELEEARAGYLAAKARNEELRAELVELQKEESQWQMYME